MSRPRPSAPEAAEIIAALDMQPHPEGGWYAETFRDRHSLNRGAERTQFSRWPAVTMLICRERHSVTQPLWHGWLGGCCSQIQKHFKGGKGHLGR